jgi:excisionase family DNA binding protein
MQKSSSCPKFGPAQPQSAGMADVVDVPTFLRSVGDLLARLDLSLEEVLSLLRGCRKELLTVEEVARAVSRDPLTVRRWIKDGRLRSIRVQGSGPRGRLLVPREELSRLVGMGLGSALPPLLTEPPSEIAAHAVGRPAELRPAPHEQDSGQPGGGPS